MGTCFYYIRCFRAILISAFRISLYLLAVYLLEGIQGNYLNLDFHAGLVLNFFPLHKPYGDNARPDGVFGGGIKSPW